MRALATPALVGAVWWASVALLVIGACVLKPTAAPKGVSLGAGAMRRVVGLDAL